ncbi:MAG: 50S ribosomal protein L5 [Nanoarchaeota archaeon]|nr:50S ribosomal protein L5 [Nanoarchaeota archaeon]
MTENSMRKIRIEKVTLNVGVGKDEDKLKKGKKLLKMITGVEAVNTTTQKRIPGWGLRPGLSIGCKITLRHKKAIEILKNLLEAKDNMLSLNNFDDQGNLAFGIAEYIDIPGLKYDPEIKIMGLEVAVTLERPGFRIKRRRIQKKKIPKTHVMAKEESVEFMKKEFNLKIEEEEDDNE